MVLKVLETLDFETLVGQVEKLKRQGHKEFIFYPSMVKLIDGVYAPSAAFIDVVRVLKEIITWDYFFIHPIKNGHYTLANSRLISPQTSDEWYEFNRTAQMNKSMVEHFIEITPEHQKHLWRPR